MLKKDKCQENNFDFENSIKELEKIVIKLEESENSLEESLKLFEKGTKLAEGCYKFLDEAEQKVTKLISVKNKN